MGATSEKGFLPTRKLFQISSLWRRGRDSNPRYGCPYAAFRVRCFQPLSHLSKPLIALENRSFFRTVEVRLLPVLLPNDFGALVYGETESRVNDSDRIGLHAFGGVHVQVGRGANL